MRVAVVAVGSEMLGGERHDTNGDWIVDRVERAGGRVGFRGVVADDVDLVAALLVSAARDHDLLVVTGGLGPTVDDRTREALAAALGRPLVEDPEMRSRIENAHRSRGYRFGPAHARQAQRPSGSRWIENPVGSAPGIADRLGSCEVVVLPGVPAEMRAMFEAATGDRFRTAPVRVVRRTLKVAGRTESSVDASLADLYPGAGRQVTILASSGIVEIRLRVDASDPDRAREALDALDRSMAARLGDDLFGRDDDTLASVVLGMLARTGRTVATAESCTGGGLGAALTSVPGSSLSYRGGVVAYADDVKTALAGVPAETVRAEGAVSAVVARLLAEGVRGRLRADHGVGITGIAGPGGGSPGKPVGLVFVAVAGPERTRVRELRLPGDRELVRARAIHAALDLLRREILPVRG